MEGLMAVCIKEWNALHEELDRLTRENEDLKSTVESMEGKRRIATINFMATIEEIERLQGVLNEIHHICYIPSNGRHAYTHFQADFDKIRALTEEFR